MPNRYEREIEEILRNLEHTEPKPGRGQKFSGSLRRKSAPRVSARRRSSFSLHFSTSEWFLIIAVIVALVAGGYAYLQDRQDIFTAALAVVGIVCLILVVLSQFVVRTPRSHSTRYGNVTVTPLRRTPFNALKTRWNLFLLKLRYQRKREH